MLEGVRPRLGESSDFARTAPTGRVEPGLQPEKQPSTDCLRDFPIVFGPKVAATRKPENSHCCSLLGREDWWQFSIVDLISQQPLRSSERRGFLGPTAGIKRARVLDF